MSHRRAIALLAVASLFLGAASSRADEATTPRLVGDEDTATANLGLGSPTAETVAFGCHRIHYSCGRPAYVGCAPRISCAPRVCCAPRISYAPIYSAYTFSTCRPVYYTPPVYYRSYSCSPICQIPGFTFQLGVASAPSLSPALPIQPQVPLQPMQPAQPALPSDGTYPYDGGPSSPVPLPQNGATPSNTPRQSLPSESRVVSLTSTTTRTPRLAYPAYGDPLPRAAQNKGDVITVKK